MQHMGRIEAFSRRFAVQGESLRQQRNRQAVQGSFDFAQDDRELDD